MTDNCITVASDTHTKYGPWVAATRLSCDQTATTHYGIVAHTTTMSAAANDTLRRPN
jgi:hypothetical protein